MKPLKKLLYARKQGVDVGAVLLIRRQDNDAVDTAESSFFRGFTSGCGAVGLARKHGVLEAVGSSPATPTIWARRAHAPAFLHPIFLIPHLKNKS